MLKLQKISSFEVLPDGHRKVVANIFADTKSDVTDGLTGADVEGLLITDELDAGSFVLTASFEPAQLNSSGQWKWG